MKTINITRKNQLTTTSWSGGTTTQLAIWPEGSSYADRNFTWRVSTAWVDADTSEFTRLPGISRKLMVLDGTLLLRHEGHHEVKLEPFGRDSFMGDWHTVSHGRATDFNLMTTCGEGTLEALHCAPGESVTPDASRACPDQNLISEVFYPLSDGIAVAVPGEETFSLEKGDVLTIVRSLETPDHGLRITNNSGNDVCVIRAVIRHR